MLERSNWVKRGFGEEIGLIADVSYRYLILVTEGQPEGNTDALNVFESRGFSGEIGVVSKRTI